MIQVGDKWLAKDGTTRTVKALLPESSDKEACAVVEYDDTIEGTLSLWACRELIDDGTWGIRQVRAGDRFKKYYDGGEEFCLRTIVEERGDDLIVEYLDTCVLGEENVRVSFTRADVQAWVDDGRWGEQR